MSRFVLALDQGTTSSRSILFDRSGRVCAVSQREFPQLFPQPGHVEHDPEAIWKTQLGTARAVLRQKSASPGSIAAIGITNQRETVVLWDRATGKPIDNAYVWQSRITADQCEKLKKKGHEEMVRAKTGLVIDAYFSATKIQYLLDKHKLHRRAERGEILAGTIDTYLLWRLTAGAVHATDPSNASRTLLFDIHRLEWDAELLELFRVPPAMLPKVFDSSGPFGETEKTLFGRPIPITGIAGDQQAATFGQACFKPGMVKNTYGTGCFLLMNTGTTAVASKHGLLSTVGWRIGGVTTYCLEGSVFIGGAAVQWLRDGLKMFRKSADVEAIAASVADSAGVYFVPAFVGLGAPHWDPYARGAIFGLERGTTQGHIARATVESMAYQTYDVVQAMAADSGLKLRELRVDGGATANEFLLQFQSDLLNTRVVRPKVAETTALGAAYLAGLAVAFWGGLHDVTKNWAEDRSCSPQMGAKDRRVHLAGWHRAVDRCRGWLAPQ